MTSAGSLRAGTAGQGGAVPQDLAAWLTGTLAPRWAERAVDPGRPGYVEVLTADGRPDASPRRTTLVTARLVYAFSHAAWLCEGQRGSAPLLAAARHGLDFLIGPCRGPDGAFRHAVALDGTQLDGRTDLYDLAFVLFGLAWHHRATGDPVARAVAHEVLDFADGRLADPGGGFREDTLGTLPRRQNPHMHLLEAYHAWAEATGEERWLVRAGAIVALLKARLLDRETGSLGEFFDAAWRPAPGAAGRLREPGHHCEWAWLLHHHARLTGDRESAAIADQLYDFALAHGTATMPEGLPVLLDGVEPDGRVVAPTRLLWPQTEAIKAHAARIEFLGDASAAARLDAGLTLLFRHYVDAETGLWCNQLSQAGVPVAAALPVRVLYHLVLGLAEAARVRPAPPLAPPPSAG